MPKHGTYRAKVLAVIDDRDCFLTAVDIVEQTELTYKQVIDVLQALHNEDLILRTGHKFTARWGSKKLEDHSASAGVQLLEDVFRGFFKK